MRELRDEVDRTGGPNIDGRRKVGDAVADYLVVRQAQALQPRTLEQDGWAAGLVIKGFGQTRVASLSVEDCDAFLAEAASGAFGRPISRPQLRRLRRKLIRILENDQRRGFVSRNVAELTVIPEESPELVGRRKARAISSAEAAQLIDVTSGVLVVLIDLSGRNGLRPPEAHGLRWSRVDLCARTLRVDAQMNRKNEIVKAKTSRSYRTIRLDRASVGRLATWRRLQQEQEISAYDLRHTAIALRVERGLPPYQIADWAGTSERMIADVYRHKLDAVTDLGPIE